MAFVETLGPWIGLIGGMVAIAWAVFSALDRFLLNRPNIIIRISKENSGIENREHPHIAGWGLHTLRVRCRITNAGRNPITISRVLLRSKGGDIIGTTCYELGTSAHGVRELKTVTLRPRESKMLLLSRERAKSIVRATSIPVILELYSDQRQVLHRQPFVLHVSSYLDENIPAPKDIAEEE